MRRCRIVAIKPPSSGGFLRLAAALAQSRNLPRRVILTMDRPRICDDDRCWRRGRRDGRFRPEDCRMTARIAA